MSDDELERLRQKKLAELRQQAVQEQGVSEQVQFLEAQKMAVLRQILTPEARERLGSLRMAWPDLVDEVEQQLIALAQTGRLPVPLDDTQLRQILARIMPQSREIKIERR